MPDCSTIEDQVRHLYQSVGLIEPSQLIIEEVAKKLGIRVRYWDFTSEAFSSNGRCFIVLNRNLNERKMWQEFAHEVAHLILHVGRQEWMHVLFRQLQEYQANYFAYHFCVPTFMLDQLEEVSVDVIMETFNVEYDFAVRRLEMYQSKQYERMKLYVQ